MRVHRFFTQRPLQKGGRVELETEPSHHIHQVLRLRVEDEVVLFNDDGNEYHARLTQVCKKLVQAEVGELLRQETESRLKIHLILAISRGERMDFAMQKATELGVNRITPIFSDRCVVKLDEKKSAGRLIHWQRIIVNACEQSGRCRIPIIDKPQDYASALSQEQISTAIMLDHRSQFPLQQIDPPATSLSLLIGPEGGLTSKERQLAARKGFIGVRLGPRILRTETAPLAAIAAAQTLWGDFSS
ncbi:MAG: 16S rRNA (uracil(1498)-N(3))-methyltransferase [Candidatus Thiodiazotropha sp.]